MLGVGDRAYNSDSCHGGGGNACPQVNRAIFFSSTGLREGTRTMHQMRGRWGVEVLRQTWERWDEGWKGAGQLSFKQAPAMILQAWQKTLRHIQDWGAVWSFLHLFQRKRCDALFLPNIPCHLSSPPPKRSSVPQTLFTIGSRLGIHSKSLCMPFWPKLTSSHSTCSIGPALTDNEGQTEILRKPTVCLYPGKHSGGAL